MKKTVQEPRETRLERLGKKVARTAIQTYSNGLRGTIIAPTEARAIETAKANGIEMIRAQGRIKRRDGSGYTTLSEPEETDAEKMFN